VKMENNEETRAYKITPKGIKAVKLLESSRLFRLFWRLDEFLFFHCKPLHRFSDALMDKIWFREFGKRRW